MIVPEKIKLKRENRFYLLISAAFVICFLFLIVSTGLSTSKKNHTEQYLFEENNRIVVQFSSSLDLEKRNKLRSSLNGRIVKIFGKNKNFAVIDLPVGLQQENAFKKLSQIKGFKKAEMVRIRKLASTNDPFFNYQWNLTDVNAPSAWDIEDGKTSTPVIAVIDSGADLDHPDLSNKIWVNSDEIPGNLKDDDKNGYIDDVYGLNITGVSQVNDRSSNYISNNRALAQTINGKGEYVTGIKLNVSKRSGNVGFYVKVCRGSPDTGLTELRTAFVSAAAVSFSFSQITAYFSSPIRFEKNTTYTILLQPASSQDSYNFREGYPFDEELFLRGEEWVNYSVGWQKIKDYDLWFRLVGIFQPYDDYGHGTAVSGVAGAETNNGRYIAGAAPYALIMPIKASLGTYLESADIIEAIYYAADNGARVINLSFAGPDKSQLEQDAINYAAEKGCLIVAAAGNDGTNDLYYPAAYDNVLGVSSYNRENLISDFSNYGSYIDLSAPGEEIPSIEAYNLNERYVPFFKGTSFSAPMVAAGGALLMSQQSELIGKSAARILTKFAVDIGVPGWDEFYGYGKVNFLNTLQNTTTPKVERFAGKDRHETSSLISKKFFSSSNAVVLARSDLFADALTASPLAAILSAPLLVTSPDTLRTDIKNEIERLSPKTVYLIGGEGALSKNVENEVKTISSVKNVIRIYGRDRYETSVKIADEIFKIRGNEFNRLYFATGENFPDALSSAPLAGAEKCPILLVKKDFLPLSVAYFLSRHRASSGIIAGGTGAVSTQIEQQLRNLFGLNITRISGKNRYETSANLVNFGINNLKILSPSKIFVATGENFPDALSSGSPAGINKIPLLLLRPSYNLDAATIQVGASLPQLQNIYVAGGKGALPSSSVSRFFEAVKCGN